MKHQPATPLPHFTRGAKYIVGGNPEEGERMKQPTSTNSITAFKGFDKDWSCRGFSYGEPAGQTFTTDKPISLCNFGFHACEAPLDIWNYYPPGDGNQAGQVVLDGVSDQRQNDTKRVGQSITIKAALSIQALIAAHIEWTFNQVKQSEKVTGEKTAITSSGDSSKAASSGNSSTAASSGNSSKAACDTNGFACVAGANGRVSGKSGSALSLGYRDKSGRNRIAVGYVGENGITADTWYCVTDQGVFVKAL